MSKTIIPPIRLLLGGEPATAQEIIDNHNKKQCPAATEQKKIS